MFRISTVDGKGKVHYHLLFVTKNGIECAENDGHTHMVDVQRETVDPATMQLVPLPNPIVIFSEEEGHTHEMGGEVILDAPEPPKDTDEDKVAKLRKLFEGAREYERDSRKRARESVDFYEGRQWELRHKDALTSKGRVALTINHVENAVDTLSGYFRQNRTDFRFYGVEKSDNIVADICTEVVRNICEQNEFAHVETCVFEDEVVSGRGLFHSYIDFDENVEGDIKIERYEWDDCYFSQHNKADASDAEHCHKSKWFSKDKIEVEYPDKAKDIRADWASYIADREDQEDDHVRVPGRQYEYAERMEGENSLVPDFVDLKRKEYRVIETEQKQYVRVPYLTRIDVDDVFSARDWSKEDVRMAKDLGFSAIRRPSHNIRYSKFAGNILLDDYVVDERDFSITPVYAKKRKDSWYGKVESAKDPQRELNKLRSQQIDIVNKMTVDGWFIERDTFTSPQEKRKFAKNSTSPGGQFETNQGKAPQRIESSPLPSGLLNAMETSRNEIKEVLNVTPEVLNSKSTSGLALIQGQKMALLGSEYLYDNMAQSKKRLGVRLVHLIQQIYTPERIKRIIHSAAQRKPLEIGGQQVNPQDMQQMQQLEMRIQQALDNGELTKLDLVVGETSHSPNKQLADFSMNLEMARVTGGAIPVEMLIESSPMSEDQKAKAMQSIERQKQAAAQAEQQKQQTEIEKSQPDAIKMQQAMQGGGRPPMR